MHHTFMHAHIPTHNLWFWPKQPPLAFSVTETSVVEMSWQKRPRPKCPRPKCPTFGRKLHRNFYKWKSRLAPVWMKDCIHIAYLTDNIKCKYRKTCVKWPLSKRPKNVVKTNYNWMQVKVLQNAPTRATVLHRFNCIRIEKIRFFKFTWWWKT